MARPPSKHPTDLELEILKVLWRDGPATVRHVRQALAPGRKLAHTSVITMMNIMVNKGYLDRKKVGGSYVNRPLVSQEATTRRMLTDLVSRAFDGSAAAVVLNLLETSDLDAEEVRRIRKLLNGKSEGKNK